jgi:iron complex outermembrane receptor protein
MKRLSHALLAFGLTTSFSLSLAAGAIPPTEPVSLSIAAQSMDAALRNFAMQSGLQVMFATELTRDLVAPAVQGKFTPEAALQLLLKNSRLQFEFVNERTVRISDARSSADKSSQAGADELEEVMVTGVRFYQPEVGRSASKMDLPLLETPMSVSIVTSDQVEARAADSLEQAFRYSAGIYSLDGGANRRVSTGFVVRGFNITGAAPLYVNGSKFPINSLSGAMEPYLYESVELLKGPASVLYGQAAPGGIINLVSKRPTRTPQRSIKLQLGSWDHRQVNADFGGPLTQDGDWGYRVTGLVRDSGTMIDHIPDDRRVVSTAFDWKPSADRKLTLLASYQQSQTMADSGKPYEGTVLPNPNGRIRPEVFVGEPGFDDVDSKGRTLGYLFEHRFNDTWQVRQNVLWFDYDVYYAAVAVFNHIGNVSTPAQARLANRYAYTRDDTDTGWSIDNQVLGNLASGRFEHTVLFGVDYSEREFARAQPLTVLGTWDIYNPVYGQQVTLPNPNHSGTDSTQLGLYAQDHIKFDERWIAMLGGRWDKAKSDDRSTPAGRATRLTRTDADAFTKRVGLMYLSEIGLAPYLSYSESFQPLAGADFAGSAFDPTEGVQYEAGIKFEPKGRNAALTIAAFELTQQNVLTLDTAHLGFQVQTGEIRSRGIEVEGRVAFGEMLDVIASYGSADAEITKSNNGDVGRRPPAVPDSTASLWLDYHLRLGVGEMSLGVGARYVGQSFDLPNAVSVSPYTDYDLSARYALEKWRFAVNIKNLQDKSYVASCAYACTYSEARNVTVSAQYNW